jgi:hypothetical protein
MSAYRLLPREGTCTFQRIVHGRKTVGRVCPHSDGGYLGIINIVGGRETFRAATTVDAFEGVVARRLGYASATDLKQRNAVVRRNNRARRAQAVNLMDALLRSLDGSKP